MAVLRRLAFWMLILTGSAQAQTFDVVLGGRVLGMMSFAQSGAGMTLNTQLDNTPLGVFNGRFDARSEPEGSAIRYVGTSNSTRKQREIVTVTSEGRVQEVKVTPLKEKTSLSAVAQVPGGMSNPVQALGRLITAKGCPGAFSIYDGRRVMTVTPTGKTKTARALTCLMAYRVVKGPGHLSPLKISKIKVQLDYKLTGDDQSLNVIRLKGGVFEVQLRR